MKISDADKNVLRELGRRQAEIGNLPVQKEKAALWRQLNGLTRTRPLVWINEIPWWEMNFDDELTLRTEDEFCRGIETGLRRTLYQWDHMRADMVVDPEIQCPYAVRDTGFGLEVNAVRSDAEGMTAADYLPVIKTEEDIEKIQMPTVTVDGEATERNYQAMCEIFDGVLPVEKIGVTHMWCAPWDILIQWWGITELYMDMIDRPQFVHQGISRMMDALVARLDQLEEQCALSAGNNSHRVGSGGLGITDELPGSDFDPRHVRPINQWGTATGQIFSEVSPDMHEEFCLQYERRWLERFGLNCYGCCEPLHNKIHLLRTIPRLRRISMSTWVDVSVAAERIGADFVFSYKPNPAVLATDGWNPEVARAELRRVLEQTRGCVVELILKDISTVRNDPPRLWKWADLAMGVAEGFS